MRKTLFCGVDLHCNNAMYVITDGRDKQLFRKRLPNRLSTVLECLEPFRQRLKVVAVESTYNWYWLVDGFQIRKADMPGCGDIGKKIKSVKRKS